ncbi:MAG: hypothetical protein ACPGWM_11285, partial [Flavobacteriales bacterium]
MKTTFSTFLGLIAALTMYSQNPYLLVEAVDNNNFEGGDTYRVYLQLTEEDQSVHAIFGEGEDLVEI